MTYLDRLRFALFLAGFLAGGLVFAGPGMAQTAGDAEADQVALIAGLEAGAGERTRTIVRTSRRSGGQLVIDRRNIPLGCASVADMSDEDSEDAPAIPSRRQRVVKRRGVRVVNSCASAGNIVLIEAE